MKNNRVIVFLGGDIFGPVGMRCVSALLPELIQNEGVDFTVINGENATAGIGVSEADVRLILAAGADAITGGNHTFEKRDFWPVLDAFPEVLRPANYPEAVGRGAAIYEKNGRRFAVLNLQGREDMLSLDCPFRRADAQLAEWAATAAFDDGSVDGTGAADGPVAEPPYILVDFHAESNQEKEALGLYLDGRVASVTGTHTHVQTADERILPGGTVYMTDLGMSGPYRSVIGVDPEFAIKRNITQVLYKMETKNTRGALRGLIVEIDPGTRKAVGVRRVEMLEAEST